MSSPQKQKVKVAYSTKSIEVIAFKLLEGLLRRAGNNPAENVKWNYKFQLKVKPQAEKDVLVFKIVFSLKLKQHKKKSVAEITTVTTFEVNKGLQSNQHKFTVLARLSNWAFGHCMGCFINRTRHTAVGELMPPNLITNEDIHQYLRKQIDSQWPEVPSK